ncbi:phosphoinositide phosphatase SAC2-like isoform X1 [Cucurbita pepo subsp. pepo]|uniref:phosphoinositide phosphatase SAC2-like isoform X1 n=1 Tax=Cucurbita pepo subsp. pepo TaxID=3664 RepID=UPI000C9D8C38|nr:phosphoinositide phosphatase SAC2-like isoform X1 [Cucurbita pepo subsp. pepo]
MGAETEQQSLIHDKLDPNSLCLQKFRLYETRSNFYMIGRDKNRTFWRVLKISRLEPSDLNILEDSTAYTDNECFDLLKRIHEGNKLTGGLKFVTTCYGIVGIIKFLGPHYMLLITKRRKIGTICGHPIYAISKSEMIPIPNSTARSNLAISKDENRYKKLLRTVDLRKDFFFSYSYNVMRSLQKNMCDNKTGHVLYDTMFVWNEFLTRGIRNILKNTIWTVALVYGFFKQVDLSLSGRDFKLTLIARRSRHYAGTRFLKRGVNEKGRVANDVETEQIVFEEDASDGRPTQISSVVQNRGSIPLFWSQETSRLNIRPDIICMIIACLCCIFLLVISLICCCNLFFLPVSKKDQNYEATRLHFENLVLRYGNPIIILNLIKTREKKPRESILRAEFSNAIKYINKSLSAENRLRFLHWDLNKHAKSKASNVLMLLGRVATYALNLTGIFYCQIDSNLGSEELVSWTNLQKNQGIDSSGENLSTEEENGENSEKDVSRAYGSGILENHPIAMFQNGVLRTNCIDCLDRTNVAQYAYGLVALGRQLHTLGLTDSPNIDLDNPLAEDLMRAYENMGDTLALQYGGSAAHNKIFSQRRGQWKAATQSQEFFRTLQRYCSNAYLDAEKQRAINVFLGYYQPQPGKPALWELDSDQHYDLGKRFPDLIDDNVRTSFKRSLSDGNILGQSESDLVHDGSSRGFPHLNEKCNTGFSDPAPEVSTCESDISLCRYTPSMCRTHIHENVQDDQMLEVDHICHDERRDSGSWSNFLDMDWISSSGNSCEDELCERSVTSLSSENVASEMKIDFMSSASESGSSSKVKQRCGTDLSHDDIITKYSEHFVDWVSHGGILFW